MVELRDALGGALTFDGKSVVQAIERLRATCWGIAKEISAGTAKEDDVIVGIACATNLSLMLAYYDVKGFQGLDETDMFLARETAGATATLCINYVKASKDT